MHTVAAVSFLNARPLIDGLDDHPDITLITDVPSRLLDTLLAKCADIALCPVIDYQVAPRSLRIVPVGAIGSNGPTHTVRVFSRTPVKQIDSVHVDGDSRTSVALLQVILDAQHGRRPRLLTLAEDSALENSRPEALLLIGDKVVRNEPDSSEYPYQLDLGEAWKKLTGLPFVFATWMALAEADLGDLPQRLARHRENNRHRLPEIVAGNASGWPADLALRYLDRILCYEIDCRELQSMEVFWARCHDLDLIAAVRPTELYRGLT